MPDNIKMKTTSFERDSRSEQAELFLALRDYIKICIGNGAKEKHRENITSFFSPEGGFCSIRVKDGAVLVGWFRGRFIDDRFGLLYGKGKTIRTQKVVTLDKATRDAIRHYVQETLVFLLEHNAMMELKSSLKKSL
ncbi:hypothetical protein [Sulfurovum sp.]|uniref:hypothetical protein n=1 Tax=Sulfurovum sp. TaxID=1969726 RepID=UPI00356ADAA6